MQQVAKWSRAEAGCRPSDNILACLDRLIARNEAEAGAWRAQLKELEQAPWRSEKMRALEASGLVARTSEAEAKPAEEELRQVKAKLERLERKLAAAGAELRMCQTQLYAYEREIRALLEENSALEAELDAARQHSVASDEPQADELMLPLVPEEETQAPRVAEETDVPVLPRAVAAAQRDPMRYVPPAAAPKGMPPCAALEPRAVQMADRMSGMA
jgi:hypothetical protein